MKKIGINGFGRIGRTSLRVWWLYHRDSVEVTLINTSGSMDVDGWAHLLKYDTNYGPLNAEITFEKIKSVKETTPEDCLIGRIFIDGRAIAITAQKDPALIPWGQFEVDTVLESTGVFLERDTAGKHLTAGAKKVILSAAAKDQDIPIYVVGVKDDDGSSDIISNASCTTNCAAPIIKVLSEKIGIQKALLNTTHAYTDDQNLQDNSHKDLRRARNSARSIIPTTTNAATAVSKVVPAVEGIFDGVSMRVPVSVGSISDIVMLLSRDTSIEEVNNLLAQAAHEELRNILAVTKEELVSQDIVGRRESSIVDLNLTNVVGGNLVRVVSWYDNEFGYCNRLIEQTLQK
ncbi:type I glyceraldehyde-3-phosphate dehydrogenase [Microgenomates group bacterium]|nr:type I glyceraldehyde-3-phosphate dehydrogenase [Microgenomates group bacterium]